MLQPLRILLRSALHPCNPNLISPQPIHSSSAHPHRPKPPPKSPPPPDQSQISALISSLPPGFTSSDISASIKSLPNPLLSLPLLHSTLRKPALLLSSSPFLAAVNLLGKSHLYREMDSAASLAFSLPSLPLPAAFFHTLIHFYSRAAGSPKRSESTRSRNLRPLPARPPSPSISFSSDPPFHQMAAVYGVEPDRHSYSYLVHGLCPQGRTRNAKEMVAEMRGKGLVMTGRAWNSIVCTLAMGGEVEEAVGVMWEGLG